jgi:anti-sigma B factor antagonist
MSQFSIHLRAINDFTVLDIAGELDAHTASQLEDVFQKLISDNKYKIIVNCSRLDYIASAGLGVFMAYIEDVRSFGGDIKLSSLKPKVYHVFDLLGFPALYDIVESDQEAIEKFKSNAVL